MTEETPQKIAIRLSKQLAMAYGENHFPINILEFAKQYSVDICPTKNKCSLCTNKDCICAIQSIKKDDNFDGWLQKTNEGWVILYNDNIKYEGRINFTLAHEFGHYLLHRNRCPHGIICSKEDIMRGNSNKVIEGEANTFASYLLMPLDNFRETAKNFEFSPSLFENLSKKYATSLTATILKWIEMTDKKAMVVFSDNGYILWCRQSKSLIMTKTVPHKFDCEEVPKLSLTYKVYNGDSKQYETNQNDIWWGKGMSSKEIVFKASKLESVITVILYENTDIHFFEEEEEKDCYDLITCR